MKTSGETVTSTNNLSESMDQIYNDTWGVCRADERFWAWREGRGGGITRVPKGIRHLNSVDFLLQISFIFSNLHAFVNLAFTLMESQ